MFNRAMNMITYQLIKVFVCVWRRVLNMLPATIAGRLNKLQQRVFDWIKLRRGTPIIVYQMGKVGSVSIRDSLESCGIESVFHVHKMNPNSIQRIRENDLAMNRTPLDWWLSERLFADIIRKGKRAQFITLVREPN